MRKSQIGEVLSRRLGLIGSRVEALALRLADAGVLPKTNSRRHPPDASEDDALALLLAVLADRGLGFAPESVAIFRDLQSDDGETFGEALAAILAGGEALFAAITGALVLRHHPPGVSWTSAHGHRQFGEPPPPNAAAKATIVPGAALSAIALELAGRSPTEADALVALARVSRALDLTAAFERVPE